MFIEKKRRNTYVLKLKLSMELNNLASFYKIKLKQSVPKVIGIVTNFMTTRTPGPSSVSWFLCRAFGEYEYECH